MSDRTQQLVSVIIPAYNAERYIAQTIESVIAQTYGTIEIIIVNDGSTDDTLEIAQTYAEKDARITIVTQKNQGVSAARNTGFKTAKGDYLCIIDGDDIVLPTKIESQVAFLAHNLSADFVYSKVYYFMDGAYDLYCHDLVTASGPRVYKKLLQHGNFIYTSTVFFKRSVFDRFGGFDEMLRSAEEFDYWLTLSHNGVVFMHQDAYLTLCRSRGNGLTSDSVTMYTDTVRVLRKHLPDFFSRIISCQYIKSSMLLFISRLRKPKSISHNAASATPHQLGVSYVVNSIFGLLKRIKFSMTFKKIHDAKLQDFLMRIETGKKHASSH